MDIRLYSVGLDTSAVSPFVTAGTIDASGAAAYAMQYYIQFLNPNLARQTSNVNSGNGGMVSDVAYDAVIGDIIIQTTDSTVINEATFMYDTATGAGHEGLHDAFCTETEHDLSVCTTDTTNDWTKITLDADEQCVEKWNIGSPGVVSTNPTEIRCVRMESKFSRLFETADTNHQDFNLAYRPFMVSAGWVIAGGTTTPLKFNPARQAVDFGEFLKVAPEADYNGALSSMTVTCASIAAAVMTFMF